MPQVPNGECCLTCEYWEQASTEAFQNPLEGNWGLCRLSHRAKSKIMVLARADYWCPEWELD